MKTTLPRKPFHLIALIAIIHLAQTPLQSEEMDALWGEQIVYLRADEAERGQLFDEGSYAMFIHWGLYSHLANRYQGNTYYGIGEWILRMAEIPVDEYMAIANEFNPVHFDADGIVRLAKDAGMKYIVITAKHHDGFAMWHSESNDFNIVDATPFSRDPLRELAEACAVHGIGLGFYYSHNQDWTYPGGVRGPEKKPDGSPADFTYYYETKCRPQIEEITSKYGPIELVWFDTPGEIPKEYVKELISIVRKNQPNALISGRAGHGLGDYVTLGDMEVPLRNIPGRWETVDTTNDSWGYAWYDQNWKTPKEVVERLVSTIARGGTYMLNIGPKGDGSVPSSAAKALRKSGQWIQRYPFVIYGADSSPWGAALPWGDVTVKDDRLFLSVFEMPDDRVLNLSGLKNSIHSANLIDGDQRIPLEVENQEGWTRIGLPAEIREPLIPVIEVQLSGTPELEEGWVSIYETDSNQAKLSAVDPSVRTTLPSEFATATNATKSKVRWMEKFGEWKHTYQVSGWKDDGRATWKIEVLEPGYYMVDLTYRGSGRLVWSVEVEDHQTIQNQQNSSHNYQTFPIGWTRFPEAGRYRLNVSLVDQSNQKKTENTVEPSLKSIHLQRINF